jgi:hypothetical protein
MISKNTWEGVGGGESPPLKHQSTMSAKEKIYPHKGSQHRVGEAVVAKHPPEESTASIRK